MEKMTYVDRRGTDCKKWDAQSAMFGVENLHGMWVADMDFKVPECVQKAICDYVQIGALGYPSVSQKYYDAFIQWEASEHGLNVEQKWIRYSPSAATTIHWLIQMVTEPNDAISVMVPIYFPFIEAVRNNGRKLVCCELMYDKGTYSVDFELFEKQIVEEKVKLFIMCSPHNPIGRVWREDEIHKVMEICDRHQVFVIADEIHQDLVLNGHKQIPALSMAKNYENIVSITAATKTFNLAGTKNSIVLIPDERVRKEWDEFTGRMRLQSGNTFGYLATEAAYRGGRKWLECVKNIIQENDLYLREVFAKELPEVIVSPLEGTYLVWINLERYVSHGTMMRFLVDRCELAVDLGEWFGGDAYDGYIRMNLATSKENVEIGVQRIIQAIKNGE